MKRQSRRGVFALAATLLLGGAAFASARPVARAGRVWRVGQTRDPQIARYDSWLRVNLLPDAISEQVAMECRLSAQTTGPIVEGKLHGPSWAISYINPAGADGFAASRADTNRPLPVGTVIVKEKWPEKDESGRKLPVPDPDASPEMLTIMSKREKGYWPKGGDWEYATATGDGRIVERGRLERCVRCHNIREVTFPDHTFMGWYASQWFVQKADSPGTP